MMLLLRCILLIFYTSSLSASDIIIWREDLDTITIDRYSLQKIFTKKQSRWPNGLPIRVFIKPMDSVEHRDFVTNILGISIFTYQQLLDAQVYSGRSYSVVELPTDEQMIMNVEKTPGAIGYINYALYIGNKKVTIINSSSIQ